MKRCVIVVMVMLAAGCGMTRTAENLEKTRELLTAEEIAKTAALNAYDAIRIRRPAFFIPPGTKPVNASDRTIPRPKVYLNGVYYGELDSLREIPVSEIKEIRYLESMDATQKYGAVHPAGAIEVNTKLY
jgi:hypothetical protein